MKHLRPILIFLLAAASIGVTPGMTQALTDPIKDAEVKKMKDDIELIKAEQDLLKARYPNIEGGKEGTITMQNQALYPFAAKVETYNALRQAADRICAKAKGWSHKTEVTVIPLDNSLTNSLAVYTMGLSGLQTIKSALETVDKQHQCTTAKPAGQGSPGRGSTGNGQELGTLPLAVAASALDSVVDFTKLFRVDRTIHIESPQMTDADLAMAVAECIPKAKLLEDAILKKLISSDAKAPQAGSRRGFLDILQDAREIRTKIENDAIGKECPPQTLTVLKTFDDYYVALGTGENIKLLQLLKAEAVIEALNAGSPSLFVSIKDVGAATQLTSGFFSGQKLYASGGIVAQYILRNGIHAEERGLVSERTDFRRIPLSD